MKFKNAWNRQLLLFKKLYYLKDVFFSFFSIDRFWHNWSFRKFCESGHFESKFSTKAEKQINEGRKTPGHVIKYARGNLFTKEWKKYFRFKSLAYSQVWKVYFFMFKKVPVVVPEIFMLVSRALENTSNSTFNNRNKVNLMRI